MRLTQVVEITRGELVNSPTIAEFEGISTDINRLKKGWLYIALEYDENIINHALSKDIYGIICTQDLQALDSEIAIIKTQNPLECVSRLVRYAIFQKEIKLYALNDAEYAIARAILRDKRAAVNNNIAQIFENISNETKFIFSSSREILSLSFDQNSLQTPLNPPFMVISYALFDMRISYKNKEYLLNLPYLFLDEFSALVNLCEQENLNIEIEKFDYLNALKPNFIDNDGNLLEYGQGQKVVVAQNDWAKFRACVRYFNKYAKWGVRCFALPKGSDFGTLQADGAKSFEYENDDELYRLILKENYNFMTILGIDDENLVKLLQNKKHSRFSQGTLF